MKGDVRCDRPHLTNNFLLRWWIRISSGVIWFLLDFPWERETFLPCLLLSYGEWHRCSLRLVEINSCLCDDELSWQWCLWSSWRMTSSVFGCRWREVKIFLGSCRCWRESCFGYFGYWDRWVLRRRWVSWLLLGSHSLLRSAWVCFYPDRRCWDLLPN